MLKVENVTKYYGSLKAVDNLSFEVEAGCIFGLLGLNGAGKTTTFRMIMGLIDDYQMLWQAMHLTKYIASKKNKDLSLVDYCPIVKKLYRYNKQV